MKRRRLDFDTAAIAARNARLRAAGHLVDSLPALPVSVGGGKVPDMGEGLPEEETLPVDVVMRMGLTGEDE